MKYIKHMTFKEWQRFNTPVKPSIRFEKFTNHFTGKKEAYTSLTMQEVLLSKYKIILTGYETKWKRRHTAIKKVVNQKNLDKGLSEINKIVGAFSSGMGCTNTKSSRKSKKDIDILMGSKSKTKRVKFFSDPKPPKRGKRKHKPKSNVDILMGSKPKGRKNKSVKIYSDRNNVRVF